MNNFRDKRQNGGVARRNSERASFNPNFNSDNKLKQRPRFDRNSEERPQYGRTNRDGESR